MDGQCLCGGVRYSVVGDPTRAVSCHCSMCRRHSGAAFLTYVSFPSTAFHIAQGSVVEYRSSPGARRSHCATCGSPLTFVADAEPETTWVTLGTLDDPSVAQPNENWFVDEKVAWIHLDESVRSWPGLPET